MIKLENIHREMNNQDVQSAVNDLYLQWMYLDLSGLENHPEEIREHLQEIFWHRNIDPTEEQFLAAERLFQSRIENAERAFSHG